MMDPLRAAGVETPEQVNTMLAAYAQHKAINSAGIDTSALLGGAQKEIQTQTQGVPLTRESMREELAEMNATEVHESGVRSYNSGIDAIAKELAGEGVEVSMVMDEINRAAKQFLVENGKRYAPGHPLAAHQSAYIPPTASDLAQIKIAAQSIIDQKRGFHTRVKAQTPMTTPMGTSQRTDGAVDQNMTAIDRLRSKQEEARAIVDRKFNG